MLSRHRCRMRLISTSLSKLTSSIRIVDSDIPYKNRQNSCDDDADADVTATAADDDDDIDGAVDADDAVWNSTPKHNAICVCVRVGERGRRSMRTIINRRYYFLFSLVH